MNGLDIQIERKFACLGLEQASLRLSDADRSLEANVGQICYAEKLRLGVVSKRTLINSFGKSLKLSSTGDAAGRIERFQPCPSNKYGT